MIRFSAISSRGIAKPSCPLRGRLRARLWYLKQALSLIDGIALGLLIGTVFGAWNLAYTRLAPLADDTPIAVASFYGPMSTIWGVAVFSAYRRTGELDGAVKLGAT